MSLSNVGVHICYTIRLNTCDRLAAAVLLQTSHSLENRSISLNTIAAATRFFIACRSSGLVAFFYSFSGHGGGAVPFFTVPRIAAGSFAYDRCAAAAGFQSRWTSMHHSDHEFYKFKQL
jgi:hypothetical protein